MATLTVGADKTYATIQLAVTAAADDDIISVDPGTYDEGARLTINKAVTIQPSSTGTITVTGSPTDYMIYVNEGSAGKAVTLNSVIVNGSYSSQCINQESADITFNMIDCQITNTHATGDGVYAAGVLVMTGGFVTVVDNPIYSIKSAVITDVNLTWTNSQVGVRWRNGGAGSYCRIIDCAISATGELSRLFGSVSAQTSYSDTVEIRGCTGSCGALVIETEYYRNFVAVDNTLTLIRTSETKLISLGVEVVDDEDQEENANPFERIVITDNVFTCSGALANHILLLGIGADNADILRNSFIVTALNSSVGSGVYGLVIKSNNYDVRDNKVYYVNAGTDVAVGAFIAGGEDGRFENNSVYASGTALLIDTHQDYVDTAGSVGMALHATVRNNILESVSGLALAVDPEAGANTETWNILCDYNVYWTGGTDLVDIDDETVVTKAAAVADQTVIMDTWAAHAANTISRLNDQNSIIADPQFVDPENGDFTIPASSPAFGAGPGDISVGAFQPDPTQKYGTTGTYGFHGG